MNGGQTMIVLIVLIATAASLIRAKNGWGGRHRRHGLMMQSDAQANALPSPREEELQREVQDLRERIKVLERIATDGRKTAQLADEIESLRDR